MKKISLIAMALVMSLSLMAKGQKQTVVFNVDLHCQGCVDKVQKNIAYEKGVKDLQCDLKKKMVTVVFDDEKTNVEQLQEAFARIKKPATVNKQATAAAYGKELDAETGATKKE